MIFLMDALSSAPAIILPDGVVISLRNKDTKLAYHISICRDGRVLVMHEDRVLATFAGVYTVLMPLEARVEECDKHE